VRSRKVTTAAVIWFRAGDELGVLTESFNLMTQQLEEARAAAQHNQQAVESARAHLESILANLSSGVLVFDGTVGFV
jgi:nitrogen fixation/metabolism regulation signal transduction histidine kinase